MSVLEIISNNYALFSYFAVYARWIVGGVLLVAGVAKARDIDEFVSTIELFYLVPRRLSKLAAHFIIGLELVTGWCLLAGIGTSWATVVAAVLFGVFALAILVNLARHNIFNCNCFGPYFKEKISARTMLRNILFIGLCLLVLQFYDGYIALDPWLFDEVTKPNHSFSTFALMTAAVIFSAISVLSARAVLKNFRLVNNKT